MTADLIYNFHAQNVSRADTLFFTLFIIWQSPHFSPVSKTNLAVHEDKNRVPYVKVKEEFYPQLFIFYFFFFFTQMHFFSTLPFACSVFAEIIHLLSEALNVQVVLVPAFKQVPWNINGLESCLFYFPGFEHCHFVKFQVFTFPFHVRYEREQLEEFCSLIFCCMDAVISQKFRTDRLG